MHLKVFMEDNPVLRRFTPGAPDCVYAKLHRQAVDTFRYRLTKGASHCRLVASNSVDLDRVREIVDSREFQPEALLLSHRPDAGIELSVDGAPVQLFCTDQGSNDALVMIIAVKSGLPDVWNELFLPLLARA